MKKFKLTNKLYDPLWWLFTFTRQLPHFFAITRGRLFKMNPLEKNGGIFVREEIIRLSIIDDKKKQVFAVIDNYDGGFDAKDIKSVADIIGITETQAHNAFMTLVGLRFLKLNNAIKWVLNEDANWQEGSR